MKKWLGVLSAAILFVPGVLLAQNTLFPRFTSQDFDSLIQRLSIQTIPELTRALPEFVKGNLTFLYDSFSAQRAHLVFKDAEGDHSGVDVPRAILWDTQGRFFLTYNGYEKARGYNTIETMEFQDSGPVPQFKFVGTVFPSREHPSFSHRPESICLDCHGDRARPIWGEYPKWEGAYGSVEDIVQPSETKNFAEFKEAAQKNPLYSELFPVSAWENFPYKKDNDIRVFSESHTFHYRPNTRMLILLNRLNAQRVFAILKSQPKYNKDRGRLAFQFLGCAKDNSGFALLKQYGLSARDLDLRYTYNDPKYDELDFSDSYFDGTATTNELLAARVVADLLEDHPELKSLAHFRTISAMYSYAHHQEEDAEFMAGADQLGAWIRTPFPNWQVKAKFRPKPTPVEAQDVRELCAKLTP